MRDPIEIKLQSPTQDYLDWLNRAVESNSNNTKTDRTAEANALDIAVVSASSIGWALNMAKNLYTTLQDYEKSGDKLKVLTSALQFLGAMASGLWTVRETVKKAAAGKP